MELVSHSTVPTWPTSQLAKARAMQTAEEEGATDTGSNQHISSLLCRVEPRLSAFHNEDVCVY